MNTRKMRWRLIVLALVGYALLLSKENRTNAVDTELTREQGYLQGVP